MFPDVFRLVFIYLTASDKNKVENGLWTILTLEEICRKCFHLRISSLISANIHENRKIKLLHYADPAVKPKQCRILIHDANGTMSHYSVLFDHFLKIYYVNFSSQHFNFVPNISAT